MHTTPPPAPPSPTVTGLLPKLRTFLDAYTPAASHEWMIWCRPAYPDQEGRYSVEEWKVACMAEYSRLLPDAWKEA